MKKSDKFEINHKELKNLLFNKITTKFTNEYYWELADKLWSLVYFSLLIDLLIILAQPHFTGLVIPTWNFLILSLACLAIAVLATFRETIFYHLEKLNSYQDKLTSINKKSLLIITALIAIIPLIELLSIFWKGGALIFVALIVFIFTSVRSIVTNLKTWQKELREIQLDKIAWVETFNQQIFFFHLIPILAARFVSIFGILAIYLSRDYLLLKYLLLFPLSSAILLYVLKPEKVDFMIQCGKCANWTSRVLKNKSFCHLCKPEYFTVKQMEAFVAKPKKKNQDLKKNLKNKFLNSVKKFKKRPR